MPLYLLQPRQGREGEWPSGIIETEKESKHTSLIKYTLFHRMYVLTEEFWTDRKHFSLLLSEWWKGCSHRENKNGKWDRCELVPKPPHQPAQTPMGYRLTSGKNCQWDWYSARMNKTWIELLRCKHKVTWAIIHLLRFALIYPFSASTVDLFTFYFMCFCHMQINKICLLTHAHSASTFGMLEYQADSLDNAEQTSLKVFVCLKFQRKQDYFFHIKMGWDM